MSRFVKGRNNLGTCDVCQRLTHIIPQYRKPDGSIGGICNPCFDEGGIINGHLDGHHKETPCQECPECFPKKPG